MVPSRARTSLAAQHGSNTTSVMNTIALPLQLSRKLAPFEESSILWGHCGQPDGSSVGVFTGNRNPSTPKYAEKIAVSNIEAFAYLIEFKEACFSQKPRFRYLAYNLLHQHRSSGTAKVLIAGVFIAERDRGTWPLVSCKNWTRWNCHSAETRKQVHSVYPGYRSLEGSGMVHRHYSLVSPQTGHPMTIRLTVDDRGRNQRIIYNTPLCVTTASSWWSITFLKWW